MMNSMPQFPRLVPIVYFKDLDAEITFYKSLGFTISYQGDEFPGFVGMESGQFDFGLQEKEDFDPDMAAASIVWQMETDSLSNVIAICRLRGIEYSEPRCYWVKWDSWEMTVQTPNGYTLHLEKYGKDLGEEPEQSKVKEYTVWFLSPLLSYCSSTAVPEWLARALARWQTVNSCALEGYAMHAAVRYGSYRSSAND